MNLRSTYTKPTAMAMDLSPADIIALSSADPGDGSGKLPVVEGNPTGPLDSKQNHFTKFTPWEDDFDETE